MKEIAAAWVKAFADIEGTVKNATNPHYHSKFADLPAVIAAIKPHLVKHGLAYLQIGHPHDRGVDIETLLVHQSGEMLSLGRLFVPATKNDAQGFGSASTYCRRFSLQTAFSIPSYDDDGELARVTAEREARNGNGAEPANPMLESLRAAAMEGSEKLTKVFEAIKDTRSRSAIWKEHGTAIKAAAAAADYVDETESI